MLSLPFINCSQHQTLLNISRGETYTVTETDENGEIKTIKVTQPESFEEQMLMYSKEYGFLPEVN